MKVHRFAAGIALGFTAVALASLRAQTPDEAAVRALLAERIAAKKSTGIVAGVIDGKTRLAAAAGASGTSRALDGDSVFEIGSISKVFTGAVLADMAARGEVSLDDPVAKYLPAAIKVPSRNGKSITLLDLTTQSSGLPRMPDNFAPKDPENPYADYSVDQLYDFLSRYELPRDPGERYEYSNVGVGLLGHALSRRAGMSWEALVTKRILVPLGMRDSAVTLSPSLRGRLALGHDDSGRVVPNWDIPTFAGAGALRSTANDMLKFLAACMGEGDPRVVAALAEAQKPRRPTTRPNLEVGLGWHVMHRGTIDVVWHNGGTGGYHSWTGFDAKRRRGVVVLSNSSSSIDDIGLHLVEPELSLNGGQS